MTARCGRYSAALRKNWSWHIEPTRFQCFVLTHKAHILNRNTKLSIFSVFINRLEHTSYLPHRGITTTPMSCNPSSLIFKITSKVDVCMTANNTDEPVFDLTEYAHYWKNEEEVPGLNLGEKTTVPKLLQQVKIQLKDYNPMIQRDFQTLPNAPTLEHKKNFSFRLMTWNTLAQGLSTGMDNFVKCPPAALKWDFRRLRILEEILTNDADVICLQEVDHFGLLQHCLRCVGFEGYFFPKPDSPALYSPQSDGPDGCAMFFRTSKFKLVEKQTLVLKTKDRIIFTNQVSVMLTLRPVDMDDASKDITIATTHLKAKQGWDHLRHSQASYLLDYIREKVSNGKVIIAGDFNAETNEPVYKAYMEHELNLDSTYRLLTGNEPEFTTWKVRGQRSGCIDVCRTIDYIWHSPNSIQPLSILSLPNESQVGEDRLPSFTYPSDHLSLAADFILV